MLRLSPIHLNELVIDATKAAVDERDDRLGHLIVVAFDDTGSLKFSVSDRTIPKHVLAGILFGAATAVLRE